MFFSLRKHLFVSNLIFFVFIYILQKFLKVICNIEQKYNRECSCYQNLCKRRIFSEHNSRKFAILRLSPVLPRKAEIRQWKHGKGHYVSFKNSSGRTSQAKLECADCGK